MVLVYVDVGDCSFFLAHGERCEKGSVSDSHIVTVPEQKEKELSFKDQLFFVFVLGIEPRAFTLSHIPQSFLFFILKQELSSC